MKRVLLLAIVAMVAVGIGTGFAATLTVGSDHLWTGSQTLTKATCTLTGTTQATDTYVDQSKATSSFGTGTTILTMPDANKVKYAYVSFDLTQCSPAIPASGGADTATLQLRLTTAPNASRTIAVMPVTSTWSNATTWNTRPSTSSSTTTTFSTGTTSNVTLNVPVTIDVDDFIKGNATNYGWRLSDTGAASAGDTSTFASSNATSNRPTLVINYEK